MLTAPVEQAQGQDAVAGYIWSLIVGCAVKVDLRQPYRRTKTRPKRWVPKSGSLIGAQVNGWVQKEPVPPIVCYLQLHYIV